MSFWQNEAGKKRGMIWTNPVIIQRLKNIDSLSSLFLIVLHFSNDLPPFKGLNLSEKDP